MTVEVYNVISYNLTQYGADPLLHVPSLSQRILTEKPVTFNRKRRQGWTRTGVRNAFSI